MVRTSYYFALLIIEDTCLYRYFLIFIWLCLVWFEFTVVYIYLWIRHRMQIPSLVCSHISKWTILVLYYHVCFCFEHFSVNSIQFGIISMYSMLLWFVDSLLLYITFVKKYCIVNVQCMLCFVHLVCRCMNVRIYSMTVYSVQHIYTFAIILLIKSTFFWVITILGSKSKIYIWCNSNVHLIK